MGLGLKATILTDPIIRDGSLSEILKCMNLVLLCVQENEADRPTMASTFLMLNGLSLPAPSHPAFFMHSISQMSMSTGTNSDQFQSRNTQFSVDEITSTHLYPR